MEEKRSINDYIKQGDFEGAIIRFNESIPVWQEKWWNALVEIYDKFTDWSKKYILDRVSQTIKTVADNVDVLINKRLYSKIIVGDKVQFFPHGTEQIYLVRFYNKKGEFVYSKYGTTSRYILKRMKEHLQTYKKDGVDSLRIDRIYNCGNMTADYYESKIRCYLLEQNKKAYIRTDRFKAEFDLEEIDRLFIEWKTNLEK